MKPKFFTHERAKENLAETIEAIHRLKPLVVLLTATSAIGPGFAIKEGYKKAYPNEKEPYFLFADPRIHHENFRDKPEIKRKIINERIKKIDKFIKRHSDNPHNARIIVYDKYGHQNKGVAVINFSKRDYSEGTPNSGSFPIANSLVNGLYGWVPTEHYIKYNNVWIVHSDPSVLYDLHKKTRTKAIFRRPIKSDEGDSGTRHPEYKRGAHGKEDRESINYLKKLGDESANLIISKGQKKKSLEHRVASIIAIGSFLASALFLSSNITGNTITDLSIKKTSFLGLGLFVIGLLASFFWLKTKTKCLAERVKNLASLHQLWK